MEDNQMDDLRLEAMDEQRLTRRGFGLFGAAVVLAAGASRLALSPAAARETEPGDDRGGHGNDDPPGDDRGGRGGSGGRSGRRREVEPGDDRGGHGNDDPAGDDRGGRHGRRGRR